MKIAALPNRLLLLFLLAIHASSMAQKPADPDPKIVKAGQLDSIAEQLRTWSEQVRELREMRKVDAARREVQAKIPINETRRFELVTKGGPITQGGTFVRLQPAVENPIRVNGELVSPSFPIGGGVAIPGQKLTPAQKNAMKVKAEQLMKQEATLKAAEEVQRKAKEASDAAEKARNEAEDAKKAAAEAARLSQVKQDEQRRAEKAEREAIREGNHHNARIRADRDRYIKEGGPFRAPASGVGGQ